MSWWKIYLIRFCQKGSGITRSLLESGHKVWISSRNEVKLNEFKNSLPSNLQERLRTIVSEISDEASCAAVRDRILSEGLNPVS